MANAPQTANFNGLISWKNGRNGAMATEVGDVRFNGFKTADNVDAGIEISYLVHNERDDTSRITDAVCVGKTTNSE